MNNEAVVGSKRAALSVADVFGNSFSLEGRDIIGSRAFRALVIADTDIEDVAVLLDQLQPGTELWRVDALSDIADTLRRALLGGYETLHFLGHGHSGSITLGGRELDVEDFTALSSGEEAWRPSLHFWSCMTGAGAKGRAFVDGIAEAFGAVVSAFSGLVGAGSRGGRWLPDVFSVDRRPVVCPFVNALAYAHTLQTNALELKSVITGTGVDVQIWLTAGTVMDNADLVLSYDTAKVNYTLAVSNPALVGWQWLSNPDPHSPGHLLIAAIPPYNSVTQSFGSINNSTTNTLLETISFTLVPGNNGFSVSLVSGTGLSVGNQPVELGVLPTLSIIVSAAPVWDSFSLPDNLVYLAGQTYALDFAVQATDPNGDAITYKAIVGQVSGTSTFEPTTSLQEISLTLTNGHLTGNVTFPADVPSGSYVVRLFADDNPADSVPGTTLDVPFTIKDTTNPAVAVTSALLTNDSTPMVSGTAEVGSTVIAVIAGATYTTTAIGGTWSIDTGSVMPTSGILGLNVNGSNSVSVTAVDAAGNTSSAATQTLVIDTLAPTTTISDLALSADTGTSQTDFITSTASQTIRATLSAALVTGEGLYGSLDNGSTWANITTKVTGTSISWDGATLLPGTNSIKLELRDAAGNARIAASQTYTLDLDTSDDNHLPIGQVSVFGTTTQNEKLYASYALFDADGLNSNTIKYQWKADGVDISNATNPDIVLSQAQVGKNISVVISYDDLKNNHESVESRLTAAIVNVNDAPTGSITIAGVAHTFEKLTASHNIQDLDGIPPGGITYQWKADGVNIFGATDEYYILMPSEAEKKITVTASYTDGYGKNESVVSAATVPVDPGEIKATGFVTINGTATQNKTLIENHTITDLNGLGSSTFLYQWQADGVDIKGATERTYQIKEAEVGKTITVSVSFVDDDGNDERLVSLTPTRAVVNVNDAPSGTVTIDGIAKEDEKLIVNTTALKDLDGIPAGAVHYQWKADGNSIAGATHSTYILTQAEVDTKITVELSYTDGHGTLESNILSAATTAVANVNDLPRIQEGYKLIVADGGVVVDATLRVNTGFLIDEDGPDFLTPEITSYQWNTEGSLISGATGKELLLTEGLRNTRISVTVTYKDAFGTVETYTSDFTDRVAKNPETPDGSVTLGGITRQDETLTATIIDPDGITDINSISYQWRVNTGTAAGWANITGATGRTFVITEAQVGKQIQVVASYIDSKNVAENPVSIATGLVVNVNDLPSGSVTLQGTATQGETLVASNTLKDPDGIAEGAIHYQWKAGGVNILEKATGSSYTLTQAEVGKTVTVVASYTDGHGTAEQVESAATTAVVNVNDAPTGTVTLSGIGQQGEMLQASNTLADADGIPAGAIQYQWQADGKDIDGATGDSYVVEQAEVGKAMTVTASYTDAQGTDESVTSAVTSPMLNINDFPTGQVTITGTAKQGQLLTANTVALDDADGLGTLNYQWQANGKIISGATNSTFILTQAEVGKAITVKVSYTDLFGQPESVRSTPPTEKVVNINDVPTGLVTVNGILKQGELLTATNTLVDPDGPAALAISYQWQADGSDIDGAEDSTYMLTQEDVGKRITVIAHYKDDYGKAESVAGEVTQVIENKNDAPTGIVTIDGITRQGGALAANTTALADADGLGVLSYQWCVNTGTTVSPIWTSIDDAIYSVYTLTGNEVGKTVAVKVSYTDNYNFAESVLSRPAQKISNTNDAPTGTVTLTGTAQQGETLTASHNLVDPDGPAVLPITWQWQADGVDIDGYTGNTLVLEEAQVGKIITAVAIYDDAGGISERVSSSATGIVENIDDPYTGTLRISGTAKEKETLTAVSTIDDADGMGELSYQWSVVTRTISGTDVWTAITGATDKTFVLTETQVGKKIGVTANYTDGYGYRAPNPVLSNMTAPVKNWNSSPTGEVIISGLVKVGKTLAADSSRLADDDNLGAISYQWYADDVAIVGATESSFKLTRAEYLTSISVKASYIDGHGYYESKDSAKTVPVTKIYTLSVSDGYLVNALVWIDDNGNKRLDWADQNLNGKWDKGEGESWALTDSSGQVTGLEGDGTILITANPKGGTFDMSTGNAFTGSFAAPSDAKVVSTLTTLVVAAMAANPESEAAAETRVRAALGLDASVTIIDYDPLAEASKTAATLTGKQIAINVESETIQVNNIMDVAVSVANAVFDKAVANNAETDPYWTEHIVQLVGIIADQLLGQAQPKVNLADATVIANVINNTLNTLTKATTGLYLPEGYTPSTAVITAIANALAKVNNNIAAIDNNATGADAPTSIKEIIQAQIVAQNTIVADAYRAVMYNNVADINASSANFPTLLKEAAAQVATIFINHTPVGNVSVNGVVMPGETLTATSALVDIEGLGTIGYQWLRDGVAITDATHEAYVLNVADIGKSITVKASYIDGAGYSESMSSDPTTAVPDAPTSLSDVVVVADELTNDATPTVHVDLSNKLLEVGDVIQIIDSNHDNAVVSSHIIIAQDLAILTVKDIELLVSLVGLIDDTHALKVQLVDGAGNAGLGSDSVTKLTVDTTLPAIINLAYASGVVTANLDAPLETGDVLSGSVDGGQTWTNIMGCVAGTVINWDGLSGADSTKLHLKIQDAAGNQNIIPPIGTDPVPVYELAVHTNYWHNNKPIQDVTVDTDILTDNLGVARIHNVPSGTKTLTPSHHVSQAEKEAVDLVDAIAILKSIVGLITLSDGYQKIAADFDGVNGVDLNDAIGILKHVVGLPAAIPEWVFVDSKSITPNPVDPISVNINTNTTVELVGILHGDVDGSWASLSV